MGSWQQQATTATPPRRVVLGLFPIPPSKCLAGQLSPIMKHEGPRGTSGESGAVGLRPGQGSRQAGKFTGRANNSSGIIFLTASSCGFGGVAGGEIRSSHSWSRSHSDLPPPQESIIFPRVSPRSRGSPSTAPAHIMGCPGAGPRLLDVSPWKRAVSPSSQSEGSTTPNAEESRWNKRGIHPPPPFHSFTLTRFISGETRNYLFPVSSAEREDTAVQDSMIHQ